jgi:hypothetical protein
MWNIEYKAPQCNPKQCKAMEWNATLSGNKTMSRPGDENIERAESNRIEPSPIESNRVNRIESNRVESIANILADNRNLDQLLIIFDAPTQLQLVFHIQQLYFLVSSG